MGQVPKIGRNTAQKSNPQDAPQSPTFTQSLQQLPRLQQHQITPQVTQQITPNLTGRKEKENGRTFRTES